MAPFFIAEYAIKFQTVSQSVPEWLGLSRRWALVILSLITQHEAEQPEQQGDAGGDALVHDAHGRFQQASSSGERTPKG